MENECDLKILEILRENKHRRQPVLSSALRGEEEWSLARLQREIIELKTFFQQLQDKQLQDKAISGQDHVFALVKDLEASSLSQDEQLSALSKKVAELEQNQTQVSDPKQSQTPLAEQASGSAAEVADLKEQRTSEDKTYAFAVDLDHHLGHAQLPDVDKVHEVGENFTMDKLDQNAIGYQFQESTWDSCSFMGFECFGVTGNLWILMGVICTIVMELLLVLVVFANYSDNPYPDEQLEGLLHWRAVVAHDIRNSDPASGVSLAALTCGQASAVATSTNQMNIVADISAFRTSSIEVLSGLNGFMLCNLALVLWCFVIVDDMILNFKFFLAVHAHPRGKSSMRQFGEQIRVVTFSTPQVLLTFLLSVLPRLGISIFLGISGVFFLGYTSQVNELLLNSVALTFILDIDELFFEVFVPHKIKAIIRAVEPLHYPGREVDTGTSGVAMRFPYKTQVIRVCAVGIAVLLCDTLLVTPFNARLDQALEYLCGGKQDLLYYKGDASNLVMRSTSPPFDSKQVYRMDFQKTSILDIMDLDPKFYSQTTALDPLINVDYTHLSALEAGGREYEMNELLCLDYTNETSVKRTYPPSSQQSGAQRAKSSQLILSQEMQGLELCSQIDFHKDCSSHNILFPRALCARQCGCDNPWTGQFFATQYSGCSGACEFRWQLNAHLLPPANISAFTDLCRDVPPSVLQYDVAWNSYMVGLRSYGSLFMSQADAERVSEAVRLGGCMGTFTIRSHVNLCVPNKHFRSVRVWCPETCGCSRSDMKECPRSCSAFPRFQLMQVGERCSFQVEIESAAECERAAQVMYYHPYPARIDAGSAAPGCFWLQAEKVLLFSSGNGTTPPLGSIAFCRQAEPLPFDRFAKTLEEQQILAKELLSST